MLRHNILCHRGYWENPDEQNSVVAFERAIKNGFGIETDIRDSSEEVVISHNPFEKNRLSLENFINEFAVTNNIRIGLNVKSDGLSGHCKKLLSGIEATKFFFFDMSIPEHIQYLNIGLPTYARISEYEPIPFMPKELQGIWVDGFETNIEIVSLAQNPDYSFQRMCFVSPELHGRDPKPFWKSLALIDKDFEFEVCTDRPYELLEFLGET